MNDVNSYGSYPSGPLQGRVRNLKFWERHPIAKWTLRVIGGLAAAGLTYTAPQTAREIVDYPVDAIAHVKYFGFSGRERHYDKMPYATAAQVSDAANFLKNLQIDGKRQTIVCPTDIPDSATYRAAEHQAFVNVDDTASKHVQLCLNTSKLIISKDSQANETVVIPIALDDAYHGKVTTDDLVQTFAAVPAATCQSITNILTENALIDLTNAGLPVGTKAHVGIVESAASLTDPSQHQNCDTWTGS